MRNLIDIQTRYQKLMGPLPASAIVAAHRRQGSTARTSERGMRTTPENAIKYLYRVMWTDPDLRAAILDIRQMDRDDLRIKKIHRRTVSAAIKGGLKLDNPNQTRSIQLAWDKFQRRLQLNRREKIMSDGRGLMMEGNLLTQWVLDPHRQVVGGIRMPSETLLPQVQANGRFKDPSRAFDQYDLSTGAKVATFPLWQMAHTRLTPDNYDDQGSMGRPYLDASRSVWRKLSMTESDLVLRRRMRAPLRMSHVLEGADDTQLEAYRAKVEQDQAEGITTDYYLNKKGGVTPVQGDTNLDQIADVVHLLDTFFSGSPAPKGLFGYSDGLNRDILEDLKRDFFEEVDALQDEQSYSYQLGFELQLLLDGMDPDNFDFTVQFAERRTETANQATDRALKLQALGASNQTALEIAGLNPETETKRRKKETGNREPYPDPTRIGVRDRPEVSVTPGNKPKGESATSISTRTGNE
ncbi:MAG: hypothetical protein GY703_16710 [Gammaproteobacteria bacterium]|nr:hypothetical protein [Gammaproteobacteria bacterium]